MEYLTIYLHLKKLIEMKAMKRGRERERERDPR